MGDITNQQAPAKVLPTVGRMVYYNAFRDILFDGKKTFFAAIITDVPNVEESVVSLAILTDNGIFFRQNIPQGQESGQWDWMPFQKDQVARLAKGTPIAQPNGEPDKVA